MIEETGQAQINSIGVRFQLNPAVLPLDLSASFNQSSFSAG
jgi:hypothetical protein